MDFFSATQPKGHRQPGCGSSLPEGPGQAGCVRGWRTPTGSALAVGGDRGGSRDVIACCDERELSPPPARVTQCQAAPAAEPLGRGGDSQSRCVFITWMLSAIQQNPAFLCLSSLPHPLHLFCSSDSLALMPQGQPHPGSPFPEPRSITPGRCRAVSTGSKIKGHRQHSAPLPGNWEESYEGRSLMRND